MRLYGYVALKAVVKFLEQEIKQPLDITLVEDSNLNYVAAITLSKTKPRSYLIQSIATQDSTLVAMIPLTNLIGDGHVSQEDLTLVSRIKEIKVDTRVLKGNQNTSDTSQNPYYVKNNVRVRYTREMLERISTIQFSNKGYDSVALNIEPVSEENKDLISIETLSNVLGLRDSNYLLYLAHMTGFPVTSDRISYHKKAKNCFSVNQVQYLLMNKLMSYPKEDTLKELITLMEDYIPTPKDEKPENSELVSAINNNIKKYK